MTLSRANILIAEAEPCVAREIKFALESVGYQVLGVVASGEEVLQQAIAEQPDLIIIDVYLSGGLDGIEVAREMQGPLGIPVVFLTAHVDEAIVERAMTVSPFGYLAKPFLPEQLQIMIDMALVRHCCLKQIEAEIQRLDATFG